MLSRLQVQYTIQQHLVGFLLYALPLSLNLNIRSRILKSSNEFKPIQTTTYSTYACIDPFWYNLRFMGRSLTWFLTLRKHFRHLTLACVYFAYPIILNLITLTKEAAQTNCEILLVVSSVLGSSIRFKLRPNISYVIPLIFPTVATGHQTHKSE